MGRTPVLPGQGWEDVEEGSAGRGGWVVEVLAPADQREERDGQAHGQPAQPRGRGAAGELGPVGGECVALRSGVPADVDPVGDLAARREHRRVRCERRVWLAARGSSRHTGRGSLASVPGRAEDDAEPAEADQPVDGLPRQGGLQHPRPAGQLGGPGADLVDPEVVTVPVAAPGVVADQDCGVLLAQQVGQSPGRLVKVGAGEPPPAYRIRVQQRPVPAVRVAEAFDAGDPQHGRGGGGLAQPDASRRLGAFTHMAVRGHDEDDPVPQRRQQGQGSPGPQRLVVRMRVKRDDRRHAADTARLGARPGVRLPAEGRQPARVGSSPASLTRPFVSPTAQTT